MTARNGDTTDAAIVARFRKTGDQRLFEALVVRHRDYVYRTVRRLVSNVEDAADLTQEVFVKAYFGLEGFRSQASLRTWLHRIAVNHCLNHLSRGPGSDSLNNPRTGALVTERGEPELRLDVQSCLMALSSGDRLALLLKYVEDLEHREIADLLSISVSASKMRVQRARERFLELYRAEKNGGCDG